MRNNANTEVCFPTEFEAIIERIATMDPVGYSKSRNYLDGAVSYLSPYISRGVISTKFVYQELLKRGFNPNTILKFIQELAWRDYWQQVWIAKGDVINNDLKHTQTPVITNGISKSLADGTTDIAAIDIGVKQLNSTGYIHNHLRMYIASISCNIAQNHWLHPAKWMYYHLLDADWASNALSWQWVAGANSNKKYYANQENINNFCYTEQTDTFLDVSYNDFENLSIPEVLTFSERLDLKTPLPESKTIIINEELPTLIYNFYNLDPVWKNNKPANRILLLEPSHFEAYPVSQKSIDFIIGLSKNIENIQIFVGEFNELTLLYRLENIYYKEHPLNIHYQGVEEQRDWMFDVKGYYPSFFAFWKKCKKEIIF
ncbi:FAD-binding domain-containing protein [Algibacter sp. L4_22]|uniref:FAD-binding domain-containing protein n=1 Tax=Algibacter sp. L4_22 TaxID=2942477 RepID=UPI00201B62FE|nr:FAD-binding domain-containing protein [Algibacter sp. L4_22]MCL5127782.1 deoxyribodipyrimidine photolyase [Algibacter sp. L4_22]